MKNTKLRNITKLQDYKEMPVIRHMSIILQHYKHYKKVCEIIDLEYKKITKLQELQLSWLKYQVQTYFYKVVWKNYNITYLIMKNTKLTNITKLQDYKEMPVIRHMSIILQHYKHYKKVCEIIDLEYKKITKLQELQLSWLKYQVQTYVYKVVWKNYNITYNPLVITRFWVGKKNP